MNVFLIVLTLVSLFIYNVVQSVLFFLTPERFRKKKDITGQKILITGAGSGLGRHLAIEFSRHTTCLVLLDINKKALLETEKLIDPRSSVFIYECDVSKPKIVHEVAESVKRDIGPVDILVNNAGVVAGQWFLDLSNEAIKKTIEVNTLGSIWVTKAFLPGMLDNNSGHLVFVSSIVGKNPSPRLTDYCASKYAIVGFAESLELELRLKKLDGLKFTIVCPAHIDTGMFNGLRDLMGGIYSAEYVAKKVVAAIQEEMETLIIPFVYTYLTMLKAIVPRWLAIRFYELSGIIGVMEDFKGRSNNNVISTPNGVKKAD